MKRLTLMRHGDAQWKDPDIADFARPLNRRGIHEVESMARRLTELRLTPDLVLASTSRRTHQTAEIITRELDLPLRSVRFEEGLYLARHKELYTVVLGSSMRIDHLMIIGHNPGLSELAQLLAGERATNGLMTAAVCSLTFNTDEWTRVNASVLHDCTSENPPTGLRSLWA